ncbi:MAG: hypothetical protein RL385_1766 [Pseudomonadota bacterium]|jgi:hypothetical protein
MAWIPARAKMGCFRERRIVRVCDHCDREHHFANARVRSASAAPWGDTDYFSTPAASTSRKALLRLTTPF